MTAHSPETQARKAEALAHALGATIADALAAPDVVEVIVNPDGAIWIERVGVGRVRSGQGLSRADAERALRLVADHVGEVVNHNNPLLSATLPGGERFQGVYGPVTTGPGFVIRKPPEKLFTLADYVAQGVMSTKQARALEAAAAARENILIAGGTGAGKTTLANAILALPVFAQDRIILIEDTRELWCAAADQMALQTRRSEPVISMADLVRASLRLRPDRIVIGEVRDGSALDLLKAWNTGHPGGLATVHANSAAEALDRLEDLIGEVSQTVPRRAIGQAIGLIGFLRRVPEGRRLESLVQVKGWRPGSGYELRAVGEAAG